MTAAATVRERPILFSGPMVGAILDGRKSQTRRAISDATAQGNYRASELLLNDARTFVDPGPSPAGNPGPYLHAFVNAPLVEKRRGWKSGDCDPEIMDRLYPRWFPGDRLWVRERFSRSKLVTTNDGKAAIWYWADGAPVDMANWGDTKPSIHMPRWASRLTLEVTEVRAERVQDMMDTDGMREGWQCDPSNLDYLPRLWYRDLWNSLNAKRGYGWEANPWVWVLVFRRVES